MVFLPELQGGDTGPAARAPAEALHDEPCGLCGDHFPANEFSQAAANVAGYPICQPCIEEMLEWNATANNP